MQRLIHRLTAEPERGATAVLAALVMTALLAAAGLSIDMGANYAKRQQLQNGADAAALAVAQEHAATGCVEDYPLAGDYADDNVRGAVTTRAISCAGNTVRVDLSGVQAHWFMPVVGKDSSTLAASATVQWGVPVAGRAALPITISECTFGSYLDHAAPGESISIWMDHPSDPYGNPCHYDYPPGGFGWLDTVGGCAAIVTLDEPGTGGWAGSKPGVPRPGGCSKQDFIDAMNQDEPVLLPIFDVDAGNGQHARYHIVKFAALDLTGFDIHQIGPGGEGCTTPPGASPALKNCLRARFVEYVGVDEGMDLVPPTGSNPTVIIRLTD